LKELRAAIKRLPKNRKLFLGLLGNFLCVDALNTLILMMSTYVVNTVYAGSGVLDRPVQILMVGLIVSSIAWSFFNGWLSGKIGSIPALLFAGLMLGVAVLSGVLLVPWPTTFMVVVVATGGAGLSGLWISGRKMVAELAPEKDRGAYFGLYGMTNKIGAMSALVFATLTAFLPKLGISEIASYRFALAFLLVPITLGSWLFGKLVLEQRRSR
ncbi:MAG: MFS transporter, partial [Planctomycetota bacterium]|nr:MFS transporter [Planctomycetota bacterium]